MFEEWMEEVGEDSEEAHVATFYVMQALARLHFPEPVPLTRNTMVEVQGNHSRVHIPYEPKEIRLWCVPVELQVFPPRMMKCKPPELKAHNWSMIGKTSKKDYRQVVKHNSNSDGHEKGQHVSFARGDGSLSSSVNVVTDLSRLGFDLTRVQSFVYIPVTRLGFDTSCLV
jgi:hypothetical protein